MASGIPGGTEIIVISTVLLFFALPLVGLYRTFQKAGKPGWAVVVPIYNIYIMARIGGVSLWWVGLTMVPYIGILGLLRLTIGLAKSFGRGLLFGIATTFVPWVGYPLLGFRDYEYTPEA